MKKVVLSVTVITFILIGCNKEPRIDSEKNFGIVLSFDDFYSSWEQHFYLFDKYDARVTFFVVGDSVSDFMLNAQNRGHEIGYHTVSHPRLSEVSREEFFEQTISRIGIFRDAGIELTSFAYPYGNYELWMNDELLQYYKSVRDVKTLEMSGRGFNNFNAKIFYSKEEMKFGLFFSASIDNIVYIKKKFLTDKIKLLQDILFRYDINRKVKYAKKHGKILLLHTHNISGDDWGITTERLEYVLQLCKKHGLKFHTFKDFQ